MEKLQNELIVLSKTWQANLFLQTVADAVEAKDQSHIGPNTVQVSF